MKYNKEVKKNPNKEKKIALFMKWFLIYIIYNFDI